MKLGDVDRARHEPLVLALREENQRLRGRIRALEAQVAAMERAQDQLAGALRMTAPLRRLQELVRHRQQERRRAMARHARHGGGALPGAAPAALRHLTCTDEQVAAHPLIARTRAWATGELLPGPTQRPIREGLGGRVLVVAHVFYPELWEDLAQRIERIPGPRDLIVTLVTGYSGALAEAIVARFPGAGILELPNRGRDMYPLVHVIDAGLVGDYDAVLKLHTKASVHRLDGAAWRERLLDSLCPSPEGIGLILELLRRDPTVGMIAPAGALLGREFWGTSGPCVDALAARTGIRCDPDEVWFPGGSMFWARPAHLNRLRDARLTIDDFEHEAVTIDGTAAHALERFVGALVHAGGQDVISADEVAGRLAALG